MGLLLVGVLAFTSLVLFTLYVRLNDYRLKRLPSRLLALSPHRCTLSDIRSTAKRLAELPISIVDQIPPKTGRRYIVVGGAGFLGGWIVNYLLQRGEDPKRIRILDLRVSERHDIKDGIARGVEFIQLDMSDAAAVEAAFHAPWAHSIGIAEQEPQLTVFHTAANIRFYERHESLLPSSARVNITGTENVIASARSAGATVLIYTSSGSVAIRRSRFWLWPWEKEPQWFVQILNDNDEMIPKSHEEFFSNYAATKIQAERRVRAADKSTSGQGILRTGCIRPGNGVFGPRGDILCGAYLVRQTNPSWISTVTQSFTYVENCTVAHLCYEQRLIELAAGSENPDIGGQSFTIADPGPTPMYGDVYETLTTLTDGVTTFPSLSPTLMLLLAHLIEIYYLSRHFLTSAGYRFAQWIPPVNSDIVNLQPSLFALTSVHLIFDDSRARLPPAKGGLGYKGAWTTLEALHKTVEEHNNGLGQVGKRADNAGVSLGFKWSKAQRSVGDVGDKVTRRVDVDSIQILGSK